MQKSQRGGTNFGGRDQPVRGRLVRPMTWDFGLGKLPWILMIKSG